MNEENQKRIIDAVSQFIADIGSAVGVEASGYEEGIQFLRSYGDKTVFDLLIIGVGRVAPFVISQQSLNRDSLGAKLDAMDTSEKARALLAQIPDPDPALIERVIKEIYSMPSGIRRVLLPIVKKLRPPTGGRKTSIPTQEESMVREEVGGYFSAGYSLPEAKIKVARDRDVSLSTIQRICKRGTIKSEQNEETSNKI